jgi:hypothetical protein
VTEIFHLLILNDFFRAAAGARQPFPEQFQEHFLPRVTGR